MNFKLNPYYNECLNVNYDDLYLNRFTDSLLILNSIDISDEDSSNRLYFNFMSIFNGELSSKTKQSIISNLKNSDNPFSDLLIALDNKDSEILFNNQILFFRNVQEFIFNRNNQFELEEFIEEKYPHSYIILRSDSDLSCFGYEEVCKNHYIKKLY